MLAKLLRQINQAWQHTTSQNQELLTLSEHTSSHSIFTCSRGVRNVLCVKLHVFAFSFPCCDVGYDFRVRVKTIFSSLYSHLLRFMFYMQFVFIDGYLCQVRLSFQIMFVSFNSSTTGVISSCSEHMSSPRCLVKFVLLNL